jgi:colanic acid/amylovoran biosynthesis glycosyltransferase
VNKPPTNICVVVPSSLGYSETFLQAHVDTLAAAVSYLDYFPIDVAAEFPDHVSNGRAEQLKLRLRRTWHEYILNPIKTIYLRNFFRRNKINVVLAEYGIIGAAVLKACKELKISLVVHFHGSDAYTHEVIDQYKHKYKEMFDYSSAIIVVSRHMVEQLIRLGAPREKVFYSPYGVDTKQFQQGCGLSAPMRVIAVGRFVEKKAPYLTILAFEKVLQRLPEAKLVMVGSGMLHDVCRRLIKSLHIEESVDLKGILSHDQVAELMQNSRVFVQHSLVPASGDCEGTPVAVLEAAASGLPVVSTKHAGIIDAVRQGETGFLVDEGDIEAMAEYIYQLLSNPDLATRMGNSARNHINENFNESNLKKLRDIVEMSSSEKATRVSINSSRKKKARLGI